MTSTRHHQRQSAHPQPASGGRALARAILAALLGLSALLACTTPAGAQAARPNLLYDTTQILPHTQNECAGATADCTTVLAAQDSLEAGQSRRVVASCPPATPFVHGWDAEQHEHLIVNLIQRTATGVSLGVRNDADAVGTLSVFLGCTVEEEAAQSTPLLQLRAAVPSNHVTPGGRQP